MGACVALLSVIPSCTGPASVIVLDAFDATSVPEYVFVFPKLSIIDCVDGSIEGNTLVDIGSNGVPVKFEDVTGLVVAPDNGEFEFESELSIIDCVVESIDGNTFVDNGPNGVPVTLEEVTGLVVAPDNGEFEFESEFNTLPRSVDEVTTAF